MDNAPYPIGCVEDGHVMTSDGWVMIGTLEKGHVMTPKGWVLLGTKLEGFVATPTGWVKDSTNSQRLGVTLAVGAAGLFIGLIGLVLANASASLLTGTGTNWTGAVISIIAVVLATLALVLLKAPLWTTIVTGAVGLLLAVLSVASVIYLEVQLEERRQEISDLF